MTIKTFKPKNQGERGLWFNVLFDKNDCLISFEEHDGYQGGPMTVPSDRTSVLAYFAERAAVRGATGEEIVDFLFDAG